MKSVVVLGFLTFCFPKSGSSGSPCPNPNDNGARCYTPPCTCPGWWGRRCEYRLECVNNNNLCAYRGTFDTSRDGVCSNWKKYTSKNPYDGNSNYCRKADSDDFLWCYPAKGGQYSRCDVPKCHTQCPPPELPVHGKVINPPRAGFPIGSNLTIDCELGYYMFGPSEVHCNARRQWSFDYLECKVCRAWRYGFNCGSACLCYKANTKSCDHVSGTCICKPGWKGMVCDTDVDECAVESKPCGVNGICHNNIGSYSCVCEPGYEAYNSTSCKDINECNSYPCGTSAVCQNTQGSYSCHCPVGYTGNPVISCNVVQCPLHLKPHSFTQQEQNFYNYNNIVHVICDPGYETFQKTSVTVLKCQASGIFNESAPVCKVRCPLHCNKMANCSISEDHACPYGECIGFWGRLCEYPLECLSSNASHYRGTVNITRSGIPCDRWDTTPSGAVGYIQPPGELHPENYCRHADDTAGVWCYTLAHSSERYQKCKVPSCSKQCNVPKLSANSIVQHPPPGGFTVGSSITITCKQGFLLFGPTTLICNQNKTWSNAAPICKVLDSGSFVCLEDSHDKCLSASKCQEICPELLPDKHSSITLKRKPFVIGDVVKVVCDMGYETKDQTTFICDLYKRWNGTVPKCTSIPSENTNQNLGGQITGPILAIVAAGIVVIIILYKRRSLRKEQNNVQLIPENTPTDTRSSTAALNEIISVTANSDAVNHTYYAFTADMKPSIRSIKVECFEDYVCKKLENKESVFGEFATLKSGLQMPSSAACELANQGKNKYKNIYPYDDNRVKLKGKPGHVGSDYINASYINGSTSYRKYIASQGPLDATVNDFWGMIWQLKTEHIVMLTNVFEEGKKKCVQYWPEHGSHRYGDIVVSLLKEDVRNDFIMREILLKKNAANRNIVQYHFTVWPDKGVPKIVSSIVNFRSKVASKSCECQSPLVVHCSAGIGRTGTFIALDYLLDQSVATGYVDVLGCVETLRRQRVNMIQTKEQYKFLHEALLDGLMHNTSKIAAHEYISRYQALLRKGKGSIDNLFTTLQRLTPKIDEKQFTSGKLPENRKKNRFINIIAVDCERPFLSTTSGTDTNYINAVFLPYRPAGHVITADLNINNDRLRSLLSKGPKYREAQPFLWGHNFKLFMDYVKDYTSGWAQHEDVESNNNRKAYLVTQMPLPHTVLDFWTLVYEQDVKSIVMLNTDIDITCKIYWPKETNHLQFGSFSISVKYSQTREFGSVTSLEFRCGQETKSVRHFRCTFWKDGCTVPDSALPILNLIKTVEARNPNDVTIIHCLNGAEKSGLYCTLATAIQQMETEQEVDFQQIIRRLRHARPQIIPNLEQFRFCHDAVMEYLNQSNIYQNA